MIAQVVVATSFIFLIFTLLHYGYFVSSLVRKKIVTSGVSYGSIFGMKVPILSVSTYEEAIVLSRIDERAKMEFNKFKQMEKRVGIALAAVALVVGLWTAYA